ncbi:MAG: TIGR04086 family membrane protein [Lachnospiraceae bacterium]|nr:TIGR04086 family membrane protein [Lachnospiraceae bacterium]
MTAKHMLSGFKILLLSLLVTVVLLLVLSLLYYKLKFGTGTVTILVFFVYVLSCLTGGFLAGKHFQTRRAIWGLGFGLLYFLLLLGISFASGKEVADHIMNLTGILAACAISGAMGGFLS